MASNIYIKIPGISGESTVEKYKEQIEALTFSYSCFQPISETPSGSIHTTGRANHGTFNFSKFTDTSSTDICSAMWSGKTIPSATITAVTNNGDDVIEYLTITLTNIVFCNYSLQGSGDSISSEEISIGFSKINVEYHIQSPEGMQLGVKSAEWNLATEKKT